MLPVRVAGYFGLSHRTNESLQTKEKSAIRDYINRCRSAININNFKILDTYNNRTLLLIAESLYIKQICTTLNNDVSSVSLFVA